MTIDTNTTGATDPAAVDQQQLNLDQPEAQEASPAPVQEQATIPQESVPQESPQERNFKALQSEVERIKNERERDRQEYQVQLEMVKANLAPKPAQSPRKMFDGMSDNDIPNVSEIRKEWDSRESMYQQRIEELQVAQQHPDYQEVIEKFAIPLVKEKPHLAEGLQGATNKALFAYELGKMAQFMKGNTTQQTQQPKPAQSTIAQKIVENAQKPGSLASTGGQSALSQADYYAGMSDEDFMKFASKNLDQI